MRKTALITIASVMLLHSCSLFIHDYEPIRYLIRGSSFTLAWDAPVTVNDSLSSIREICTGYRLYYREYYRDYIVPLGKWIFIAEIPYSRTPEFTIRSGDIPFGNLEFAVSAVYSDGSETAKHISTESSADPPTGWYVFWIETE